MYLILFYALRKGCRTTDSENVDIPCTMPDVLGIHVYKQNGPS